MADRREKLGSQCRDLKRKEEGREVWVFQA